MAFFYVSSSFFFALEQCLYRAWKLFLKIRITSKKLSTLDRCNVEDHSFKKATLFGPTSFSYHHYSTLGVLCICSTFLDLSPCSDPLYINSPTTIVGTMLAESKKPYSSLKVGLSFLLRCCAASLLEFTNQDSSIFIVLFQSLYSYSIHAHFPLSSSRQQAPFSFFLEGQQ